MPQRLARAEATAALTSAQARALAVDLLARALPVDVAGYRYGAADLYNTLVAAAAQQRSLESVCRQLVGAPTGNLVRQYLAERLLWQQDLDTLDARCQALLTARLPADLLARRQHLAIDLTLVPYYGAPALLPGEVRRGEAKAGTTRFHCYATAFVLRDGRRVTLAATFVWAEDEVLDVLDDLLGRVRRLGVRIECLYLDRGFASVALFQYLTRQPFTSVVALPKRGARLKTLFTGRRGYRTTHTMTSAAAGSVAFPLVVACHYAAGRRGKRGVEYQPFAVLGRPDRLPPVPRLAREYRQRFGIETGYRLMHQVRAPTTSRDPALRLLPVTVALLLVNLWVWLKTALLTYTPHRHRPAARRWLNRWFPLDRWRDLLIEALRATYGTATALCYPFPLPCPPEL